MWRRLILRASMPLGALAFWICMIVAIRCFPSEYDWRYMTTSQLIYPERNPVGHWWASAALMSCAAAGLLWLFALPGRNPPLRGLRILAAGYSCMILSSVLPERWVSIHNGHEILAIVGFVSVCCGLLLLCVQTWTPERGSPRWVPVSLATIAFMPLAITGLTQAYITARRPDLPWVGLAWRARGVPLYLSFALWEWVTCAILSALMTGIGIAVGDDACRRSNC